MSKADKNNDGLMDFTEFVRYCREHEKKLWFVFDDLDVNKDGNRGCIDVIVQVIHIC